MLSRLFSTSSTISEHDDHYHSYQPTPRWGHSAATINGKLYIWGGCMENLPKVHSSAEKTQLLSIVEVFDPHTLLWERKHTTGNPPLGVYWNAYSTQEKNMHTFGGYCGHGKCYHNSVHQLDIIAMQWREMMPSNPGDSPMKKWQCGMASFSLGEENYLCVFGGWGVLSPNHKNMEHEFVADRANLGCVWSNELHFFNLTKGSWECPSTTGSRPPPCQGFTFTLVDADRVILFGGFQPSTRRRVNDVYILNLHTKHWIRLYNHLDPSIPWPLGRDDHSACVKNGTCPLLLTVGGVNNQFNTLGDLWVFDVDSGRWKQISAPQTAVGRRGHSIMVFSLGPRHFLLVIYGGISEWLVDKSHREQPIMTETAVVEFVQSDGGQWNVRHEEPQTLLIPSSSSIEMKEPAFRENGVKHSILAQKTEIPDKKTRRGRNNSSSMTLDRKSLAQKQLEEARKDIKQLQGQLIDAVNALRAARRSMQNSEAKKEEAMKDMEEVKKELQLVQSQVIDAQERAQIAEKTSDDQKLEIEDLKSHKSFSSSPERGESPLSEKMSFQNEESLQHLWLVSKDEIQLSQGEIARGSWSVCKVASFRGLHVAARCFKEGVLTEDTTPNYIKVMNTALRARHPNLMQFIGATIGPEPTILTELMPTTLKMTLRQGPLAKRQVLSVASDIAGVLNYLHKWKPDPIIHRNVSTSTVLLEPMGNNTWKAKLSDYCSSNFINSLSLTSSSPNLHTSIFAAPEIKSPELHSPQMDVYSFGVVLLEMCQPTDGIAPNKDLLPRLQCLVWTTVASIVRACTATAPTDRITMSEVIKRISCGSMRETLL